MNISRRSFLKLAALSTAAVAVSASMTGCATVLKPNVSVVLQEKAGTDGKYAFTGDAKNLIADHKAWEKGRKVASSEEVSLAKLADKIKDMTADSAKKLVKDTLAKDYNVGSKNINLDTQDAALKFEATNATHYVLTITFTVS